MNTSSPQPESIFKRVLLLYGAYMLLNNGAYLVGFYLLPEGFMRGSPQTATARLADSATSFGTEFTLTLLFNLGMVALLGMLLNLNQVRGIPTGYVIPLVLGVTGGLIAGTNSFVASDLTQFSVWEGMALSLGIGNLEMLGYICVIAATVKLGIYQYKSWWRWTGEWAAIKTGELRDVRLDRFEVAFLIIGFALVVFGAYRETLMAWNML